MNHMHFPLDCSQVHWIRKEGIYTGRGEGWNSDRRICNKHRSAPQMNHQIYKNKSLNRIVWYNLHLHYSFLGEPSAQVPFPNQGILYTHRRVSKHECSAVFVV